MKYFYVIKKGKIINKRDYTMMLEIKNNVSIKGTEERFGTVNQDGKKILKHEYDDMKFLGSNYILGTVKDKIYIFDYEEENLLEINKNEIKGMYGNQINTKDKIYLFKEI